MLSVVHTCVTLHNIQYYNEGASYCSYHGSFHIHHVYDQLMR